MKKKNDNSIRKVNKFEISEYILKLNADLNRSSFCNCSHTDGEITKICKFCVIHLVCKVQLISFRLISFLELMCDFLVGRKGGTSTIQTWKLKSNRENKMIVCVLCALHLDVYFIGVCG